jgi:hypothetical protein
MAGFDAELYLRLKGEDALLQPADTNQLPRPPLVDAAAALVAIGVISTDAAREISSDYALAAALRTNRGGLRTRQLVQARNRRIGQHQTTTSFGSSSGAPGRGRQRTPSRPQHAGAAPPRVVPCNHTLELAAGTLSVRYVSLADNATTVAVRFHPPPEQQLRLRRNPMAMGLRGQPPQFTLTDDQGTAVTTHFSGGGGGGTWEGQLHAGPLARDAAWIELDGRRIDLIDLPTAASCVVESVTSATPALDHLWAHVASPNMAFHRSSSALEDAIDSLVAAGALTADDPALDDIRAVSDALQPGPMRASPGRALPQPWQSLFVRAGRTDGPTGGVCLSFAPVEIDGVTVSIPIVESAEDGFEIQVEVSPPVGMSGPFEDTIDGQRLNWWAADDRGNHYLGRTGGWSSGGDRATGTNNYGPAHDPRATRLDLIPTGKTTRAVITVTLPWADAAAAPVAGAS